MRISYRLRLRSHDPSALLPATRFMRAPVGAQWELQIYNYVHFRPHEALGGATPAEIYFGRTPSHLSAIPPRRGRPGEGPLDLPFRIEYLDAERLLPVLTQQAA